MKKWNAPELQVLEINATENGCLPWFWESCISSVPTCPGDENQPQPQPEDPKGPSDTPDNDDPTESLS